SFRRCPFKAARRQLSRPGGETVDSAPSEAHEMSDSVTHTRLARLASCAERPAQEVTRGTALLGARDIEIDHYGAEQGEATAPPEQAHRSGGELQPIHDATLGKLCPVWTR